MACTGSERYPWGKLSFEMVFMVKSFGPIADIAGSVFAAKTTSTFEDKSLALALEGNARRAPTKTDAETAANNPNAINNTTDHFMLSHLFLQERNLHPSCNDHGPSLAIETEI